MPMTLSSSKQGKLMMGMGVHEMSTSTRRAPKGHFVVYVGSEMKRFAVPTSYLKHPLFQQLLEKSAEEYGFDYQQGIVLPCHVSAFQKLTSFLAKTS